MSWESQHGDSPALQAVYLSILTILPGDCVWCFESWNIISESECYKASLLNEPFSLLFRVESLFFLKQVKSSSCVRVMFFLVLIQSPFSEQKKWQYLQAQEVPILNFVTPDSWPKKMEKSKNHLTACLERAWMLLRSLFAENSVLG